MKNIRWIIRALVLGCLVGLTSYFLSWSIAKASELRQSQQWLVWLLPVSCILISLAYEKTSGRLREFSNNAMDLINERLIAKTNPTSVASEKGWDTDQLGVPVKLAPLVLATTFLSHLTGASIGKEGAGVQIGIAVSAIIYALERRMRKNIILDTDIEIYLITGAGAAFGSLFNAPIAGTLFGLQFAGPKYNRLDALLPCLVSSFAASLVSRSLGIERPFIAGIEAISFSLSNILWTIAFGVVLGLCSSAFLWLSKTLKHLWGSLRIKDVYRKLLGSLAVLGLYCLVSLSWGSNPYAGLSAVLINEGPWYGALIKLALTSLCLACGFTGGEVVPSLVIGSSLLRAFAFTGIPLPVLSCLGALGFLSGATGLPVVCFALGLEVFGTQNAGLCFLCCAVSCLCKAKGSIYENQI
ncbi:MAG: chloride channel protein [Sphaerochaetaceae bacterium]